MIPVEGEQPCPAVCVDDGLEIDDVDVEGNDLRRGDPAPTPLVGVGNGYQAEEQLACRRPLLLTQLAEEVIGTTGKDPPKAPHRLVGLEVQLGASASIEQLGEGVLEER